jgi:hypothetical protein
MDLTRQSGGVCVMYQNSKLFWRWPLPLGVEEQVQAEHLRDPEGSHRGRVWEPLMKRWKRWDEVLKDVLVEAESADGRGWLTDAPMPLAAFDSL